MASHGELFTSPHTRGLDEDDVATHRSPDQSDGYARPLDAFFDFFLRAELWHAEIFANDVRGHDHLFSFAFGDTPRLLARHRSNLPLEIADAGFAGKAVNDFAKRIVAKFKLLADLQAVFGSLLGDQIPVSYVQFLFAGITGQFDDLHAVPQGFRYGVHPVCGGDEKHL